MCPHTFHAGKDLASHLARRTRSHWCCSQGQCILLDKCICRHWVYPAGRCSWLRFYKGWLHSCPVQCSVSPATLLGRCRCSCLRWTSGRCPHVGRASCCTRLTPASRTGSSWIQRGRCTGSWGLDRVAGPRCMCRHSGIWGRPCGKGLGAGSTPQHSQEDTWK